MVPLPFKNDDMALWSSEIRVLHVPGQVPAQGQQFGGPHNTPATWQFGSLGLIGSSIEPD
jgi:hypothetical protein